MEPVHNRPENQPGTDPNRAADAPAVGSEPSTGALPNGTVAGRGPDDRRSFFYPVPVASLLTDLVTGFDLYMRTPSGDKFYLYRRSDFVLTGDHRRKLQNSGVRDLYIACQDRDTYLKYMEKNLGQVVGDPAVPPAQKSAIIYDCSSALVRDALRRPWDGENHQRTKRLVRSTVSHLLRGPEHVTSMVRLLATDYRLYTHSVNVCVLGLGLAERTGLSSEEMRELGMGLLLHDAGLADLSPAIVAKHARGEALSEDEEKAYRMHCQRGVDLLRRTQQLPPCTLAVVLQHHERCNGQGYPAAVRGSHIHLYAKIAAVADAFDSLTTCGRSGQVRTSFEALALMQGEMLREFHADLLRSLILMLGRVATQDQASPATAPPEGAVSGTKVPPPADQTEDAA